MPKLTLVPVVGHPDYVAGGAPIELEVIEGVSVLDAATLHGVLIPTRCGGHTDCRACQIDAAAQPGLSPMLAEEEEALLDEDAPAGRRLACQARVLADATVTLVNPLEV